MNRVLISVLSAVIGLSSASIASAEKCVGKWDGKASTSVTFKKSDRLRYCFERRCWNEEYLGNKARKISFRLGTSGATVEMVSKKYGYAATWRNGSQSSRAKLVCK